MEEADIRDLYDGNFYHVCTNGLEQITLLKDEEDYKAAWNYLALSAWKTGALIIVFKKCSILKPLFFNNRTSIPQLSRILGMSRQLIQRILST